MKCIPKLFSLSLCCLVIAGTVKGQTLFSLSSDVNLQRSVKKGQEYWAVGQTVTLHYNFTPQDAAYAWVAYFSNGKFTNRNLLAEVKEPGTIPVAIRYDNTAKMRFKHISLGWKHYFTGSAVSERKPGIYSLAGLGILLGLVSNSQSVVIDSAMYQMPVVPGSQNFKRLSIDLGLGAEVPLGADLYLYGELKAILPITDYPSRYILDNKYTPYTAMAALGFRILFN
ncbi:MAG: hypothetical protein EOO05_03275 [Chitinophagaceae bacterium]|nr:MAG: hypothetical protein EOO05_03275 [Chitinophagaceae bacterium]